MSRTAIYGLLNGDAGLAALGVAEGSVYGSNSVDSPPEKRFVILHFGFGLRAFGQTGDRVLSVWAHDRGSHDYTAVDSILARVRELLDGAYHVPGVDDILTLATWTGDSDDLLDEGYGTITRNSSYTIVSRKR